MNDYGELFEEWGTSKICNVCGIVTLPVVDAIVFDVMVPSIRLPEVNFVYLLVWKQARTTVYVEVIDGSSIRCSGTLGIFYYR